MKEMKMHQHHDAFEEKVKPVLYKIGMFANMNRVTIKTLRYGDCPTDSKVFTGRMLSG